MYLFLTTYIDAKYHTNNKYKKIEIKQKRKNIAILK